MGFYQGNKTDDTENRAVDFEKIGAKAKSLKIHYIETSAKDGTNINEVFNDMARKIMDKISETGKREDGRLIRPGEEGSQGGSKGCIC